MAKRKKTYKVTGSQPVVVRGTSQQPDSIFDATPDEVEFLIQIGAVKVVEKKD